MHDRMLGRTAFLGVVGADLAGLFRGRDAMRLAGRIVPDPHVGYGEQGYDEDAWVGASNGL